MTRNPAVVTTRDWTMEFVVSRLLDTARVTVSFLRKVKSIACSKDDCTENRQTLKFYFLAVVLFIGVALPGSALHKLFVDIESSQRQYIYVNFSHDSSRNSLEMGRLNEWFVISGQTNSSRS